jgi:hypothetical protein
MHVTLTTTGETSRRVALRAPARWREVLGQA